MFEKKKKIIMDKRKMLKIRGIEVEIIKKKKKEEKIGIEMRENGGIGFEERRLVKGMEKKEEIIEIGGED